MKTKPTILFLLHLPPPVHGSTIVGMSVLNSTLIKDSFDIAHINLLASRELTDTGKINLKKVIGFVSILYKLFKQIVTHKPKLCYLALTSTGAAFYKDLILVAFLKLFGIRRVYHMHNKGVSLHQHKAFNRRCYQFVFDGADVILLSKYLYPDIQMFVPESKVHVCPNGISDGCERYKRSEPNIDVSSSLLNSTRSNESKTVKLLFLSNLLQAKGVFVLLEACALLKQRNVSFQCVFIGSEGDISRADFEATADQLHLTHEVNYLGKRFGEEKSRAFSESDIFVFPTYFETFGLVNVEAMQYALPVVASYEGGIPDIVEQNVTGFLVPPKDAQALARKLELLINDPNLRREMGLAGRRRYEQHFTFGQFERRLTTILIDIATTPTI